MPTDKMERFTQRARSVLTLAQEAAEKLKHEYIGAEHLLLALLRQHDSIAYKVLDDLGIAEPRVAEMVEELSQAKLLPPGTSIELSSGVKELLERAVDEARRMGHHYIGTEHLLLGLVRETESVAVDILKRLGVSPEEVRHRTRHVLQESPQQYTKSEEVAAVPPPQLIQSDEAASPAVPPVPPEEIARLRKEIEGRMAAETAEAPIPTQSDPPNKMERFTQRARRVLNLAQEEAEGYKHNYIGTEHLLLGLMREDGGVAGRVLRDMGLELEKVRDQMEKFTRAQPRDPYHAPDLTPGVKRVLELAVDEARRMGHHYIGTEHILLGLVRQSEGVVIDVLKRLNVSPEDVRRQTRRVLQESPQQPEAQEAAAIPVPTTPVTRAAFPAIRPGPNVERMRILDMLESGKITAAEAAELLKALQPDPEIISDLHTRTFARRAAAWQRIKLVVTDKTSGEVTFEATFPVDKQTLGSFFLADKADRFLIENKSYHIQVDLLEGDENTL